MKLPRISGRHRILLSLVIASLAVVGLGVVARAHSDKLLKVAVTQWRGRLGASLGPTQEFLSAWVEDRFADAREAARMIAAPSVLHHSGALHDARADIRLDDSLVQNVITRMHRSGFLDVWVIDTNGTVVMSEGGATPLASEIAAARGAARTFTELVTGPAVDSTGRARVAVMTPVPVQHLALVLVYDAGQALFPLVTREGGTERTIRTKIIAADTAGFHVLSPSTYPASEALGRVVPRQTAPVAWQRAVDGVDTTGTFIDLDGQPIIAATTFVAGAKWGLVRAIDEREAVASTQSDFQAECLVVLSLLAVCATICVAVYGDSRKRQRVETLHRRVRESAEEHRRVVEMRDEMERQVVSRTSELRTALEAAELANKTKSEFLARMSHELRTPLNSVIGFANVLTKNKAGNLRPQDLSYIERVGANGKHLLSLINSILDLAKIESGKMEAEFTEVQLGTLVTEVVEQLEGVLRDRPVTLVADVPQQMASIRSDAAKLHQILVNLVGNAAKFTERGNITVRVVTHSHTTRPRRIEVSDTGIGIPADRLQTVFKPFEQADNSTARRYGGTGLGLAITCSLCELLHARLTVESTVGLGSTFTVHLEDDVENGTDGTLGLEPESVPMTAPLVSLPAPRIDLPPMMPGEQVVLVIDDDEDSRIVLRQYIEHAGYRVIEAASGAEGLQLAVTRVPDVILLDLMMPGMSGMTFLTQLRSDPRSAQIRVVVVTMQELSSVERSALDAQTLAIVEKGAALEGQLEQVFDNMSLQLPVGNEVSTS